MEWSRSIIISALFVGGFFLFGCAHYQAGDGSTVPFSSIQINPVDNQSLAPQINEVLNHDLRQAFVRSGKVSVENLDAESQLSVTITNFGRETVATNSQDTGLARKYTLSLVASCDLTSANVEAPYFLERRVSASIDVFLNSGQTRAETHGIPLLSKKLAEAITNEVLQVW